MPIGWFTGPNGERVEFAEAPAYFDDHGMPWFAVEAILRDLDPNPSFHVRPSDVVPAFTCRRQRVWQTRHEYGVSPLDQEAMGEGTALHTYYKAQEVEVPGKKAEWTDLSGEHQETYIHTPGGYIETDHVTSVEVTMGGRLEVCGVPMRGRIDWLDTERITDLKTKTPFWAVKSGAKGSGERAYAYIWEPKSDEDDIQGWNIQLSIYRILLLKAGQDAPTMGRVWRRYSGVKSDKPRWKRFDFELMDEVELERLVGEWMRSLQAALKAAETDAEAWKVAPADGRGMVGSRGNYWKCDPCPLKDACFSYEKLEIF